jgi:hypothetical protein
MAQQKQGSHNAPSHESQVKGGQKTQKQQSENKMGNRTPPSHEASAKSGEHTHSGSGNK